MLPRACFVLLLAMAACGYDAPPAARPTSKPAGTAAASPATSQPSSATSQPSSATSQPSSAASAGPPTVQCLGAAEIDADLPLQWKLNNQLSVVKVAPDDTLNLRSGPGVAEKVVGTLAHDQRGILASGKACRVDGKGLWLEVTAAKAKGWANTSFLLPTTAPQDKTAAYQKLLTGPYPSAFALLAAIGRAKEAAAADPEVPYKVKLIGSLRKKGSASAVLHQCCYADDALAGEQVWLELKEAAGGWQLLSAHEVLLCPRGASEATHCK